MAARYQKYGAFRDHVAGIRMVLDNGHLSSAVRIIVVHGTNEPLLGETTRYIRDGALSTGAAVSSLDACSLDEASLLAMTQQDSLFEASSLYLVRRCEASKTLGKTLAAAANLANMPSQVCFVFQGDQIPTALKAVLTKAKAVFVPCFTPWPNELPQVVSYLADGLGLKLKPDAIQALLSCNGDDLGKNINEIRRLSLSMGGCSGSISVDDLTPHLGVIRADDATRLERLLLNRQWAKAHALTSQLLGRGDKALQILAILANHARTALRISTARSRGISPAAMASAVNLPPFIVKSYLPNLSSMSNPRSYKLALSRCQEADALLKSDRYSEDLLLARVIDALAST